MSLKAESEISPFMAGIKCCCPRCGKGRLFTGFLSPVAICDHCQLDLEFADSGDGPAIFAMMLIGFVVVALALIVEIKYQPPYWLHAVLWLPLSLVLTLGLLRPLKATMVALQYYHQARQGELDE